MITGNGNDCDGTLGLQSSSGKSYRILRSSSLALGRCEFRIHTKTD